MIVRIVVAVTNDSTVLTDTEVESYTHAYYHQVRYDLKHHWLTDALVYFAPEAELIGSDVWRIHFQDTLDVTGALGYHDLTDLNVPVSLIGARLDLDNGASPSVTGSHELVEMLVDPFLSQATQTGSSTFVGCEVGDPVEADEYGYTYQGVLLSDFVTPQWFEPGAPGPYDYKGHVTQPLQLLAGGYMSTWTPDQGWQQSYAEATPSQRARNSLRSWARAIREPVTVPPV